MNSDCHLVGELPPRNRIRLSRVLVVGDVMLDRYWHGSVSRISPEAPVPIVHVLREEDKLGGAANVALNVNALGGQVTLLGMIGRDDAARSIRKLLSIRGIDADLGEDPNMETIVKLRVVGSSQHILRIDFEREPDHAVLFSMIERFEALLINHDVVLFSDYGKGSLVHIQNMIKLARRAGKPVLVDPKGSDWARYSGASVITPNRSELECVLGSWTSESQLKEKAQALRQQLKLQALLVTRSEEGMTLFEESCSSSVPALAHEVVDVTGAGDTVIATLALLVAAGMTLHEAMTWANRAGGIVVVKFGAASLTYEELHG